MWVYQYSCTPRSGLTVEGTVMTWVLRLSHSFEPSQSLSVHDPGERPFRGGRFVHGGLAGRRGGLGLAGGRSHHRPAQPATREYSPWGRNGACMGQGE